MGGGIFPCQFNEKKLVSVSLPFAEYLFSDTSIISCYPTSVPKRKPEILVE